MRVGRIGVAIAAVAVLASACGGVANDEAKETSPEGWDEPKPYIRIVPQPS